MLGPLILITIVLTPIKTAIANVHSTEIGCDPERVPNPMNGKVQISFNEFKVEFNKNYRSIAEQQKGCRTYYRNLEIMEERSKSISWEIGINSHSDMTYEELKQYWGLKARNKRKQRVRKRRGNLRTQPLNANLFPSSLNWAQLGKVTSIKQQGDCGSCTAFSTAAYGESKLIIEGGLDISIDLSQQFLLDCTQDMGCQQGGFVEQIFKTAAKGLPLESQLPYIQRDGAISYSQCSSYQTLSFGNIPRYQYGLSDQQIIALLQRGPLAASVTAEDWIDYRGGVFKCQAYSQQKSYQDNDPIDHSGLLVGYTQDYWIFKNQWGADWGEGGYIRITRQKLHNCEVNAEIFYMEGRVNPVPKSVNENQQQNQPSTTNQPQNIPNQEFSESPNENQQPSSEETNDFNYGNWFDDQNNFQYFTTPENLNTENSQDQQGLDPYGQYDPYQNQDEEYEEEQPYNPNLNYQSTNQQPQENNLPEDSNLNDNPNQYYDSQDPTNDPYDNPNTDDDPYDDDPYDDDPYYDDPYYDAINANDNPYYDDTDYDDGGDPYYDDPYYQQGETNEDDYY